MSRQTTRRAVGAFLAGAAAWLSGGVAPAAARELPRHLLRAAFDDPARARMLGRLCLKALPNQSPAALAQAVIANIPALVFISRTALKRTLARRIREDFQEGRMIAVEGWHLSATEVRLYALAALQQDGMV